MLKRRLMLRTAAALPPAWALSACVRQKRDRLTIAVGFETLQTEGWVAGFEGIRTELDRRKIEMLEAIADGDANRQLEQVKSFIARRVDGIIVAPKDAHTVIPMIKAANRYNIPFISFNRPPAPSRARSVTIGVDNFQITKDTVLHMCKRARAEMPARGGRKHQALILMGDLGDMNALGRRDGFEAAVKQNSDIIDVVTRVPTEWNQEKALAGVTNGLQAHRDISFMFTSSDFLLPSVVSGLKASGKYRRVGEPGHVILGSFDGDAMAYQMLKDRYLDADGVQDLAYQGALAVQAIVAWREGKKQATIVRDPGLVVHQDNIAETVERMWGAAFAHGAGRGGHAREEGS